MYVNWPKRWSFPVCVTEHYSKSKQAKQTTFIIAGLTIKLESIWKTKDVVYHHAYVTAARGRIGILLGKICGGNPRPGYSNRNSS